jgi:hypothetical protein
LEKDHDFLHFDTAFLIHSHLCAADGYDEAPETCLISDEEEIPDVAQMAVIAAWGLQV